MFGCWHLVFFKASGELLQDLATLNRTGNVVITTKRSRMTLHIPMGFSSLSLEYGHYDLSFMSIKLKGRIDISTSGSSLSAAIDVVKEGSKYSTEAGLAKLQTLGQANNVTFTGPKVLNQFLSTVLSHVLNKANIMKKIEKTVNSKLKDALKEGIVKTDICALLHYN